MPRGRAARHTERLVERKAFGRDLADRDAGAHQAVGDAVDQRLPGRLDDVAGHADRLPRRRAVGGLDEHAGHGVGAVGGVEDAHPEVDQLELVELGVGRRQGAAQRVVERVDRAVALAGRDDPLAAGDAP